MSKQNRLAVNFYQLSKRALTPASRVKLVIDSSFDEKIAFHKMHNELKARSKNREAGLLEDYYPFLKLSNRWHLSTVRMYNYLKAAQYALSTFENEYIQAVFDVVQTAKRYQKAYTELDQKLVVNGYDNYEGYQKALSQLYIEHMEVQTSIFDRVAA